MGRVDFYVNICTYLRNCSYVLASTLSALQIGTHLILKVTQEVGIIFLMWKLRHRERWNYLPEVTSLWGSEAGPQMDFSCTPESMVLTTSLSFLLTPEEPPASLQLLAALGGKPLRSRRAANSCCLHGAHSFWYLKVAESNG